MHSVDSGPEDPGPQPKLQTWVQACAPPSPLRHPTHPLLSAMQVDLFLHAGGMWESRAPYKSSFMPPIHPPTKNKEKNMERSLPDLAPVILLCRCGTSAPLLTIVHCSNLTALEILFSRKRETLVCNGYQTHAWVLKHPHSKVKPVCFDAFCPTHIKELGVLSCMSMSTCKHRILKKYIRLEALQCLPSSPSTTSSPPLPSPARAPINCFVIELNMRATCKRCKTYRIRNGVIEGTA